MIEQGKELKEINRLYREMDEIYHEISRRAGLSDSAFAILYSIAEMGGGCLQKDIAAMYCMSRQTVNSSIKNLEEGGYLSLKGGRGHDRHIFLTPAGHQLLEEKIVPVIELENSVFSSMTKEESSELLRLAKKYADLYRERMGEAGHED